MTALADDTARPSKRMEIAGAAIALLGFAVLIVASRAIEVRQETGGVDPRWWPQLLGTVGVVLSVLLLVRAVTRPPLARGDVQAATRDGRVRAALTVALAALYIVTWPVAGFLVTTPPFLVAGMYLFGGRGWKTLLVFPVALTACIYLLFNASLQVPL